MYLSVSHNSLAAVCRCWSTSTLHSEGKSKLHACDGTMLFDNSQSIMYLNVSVAGREKEKKADWDFKDKVCLHRERSMIITNYEVHNTSQGALS